MVKGKFEKKKGKRVEYLGFETLKILKITGKPWEYWNIIETI